MSEFLEKSGSQHPIALYGCQISRPAEFFGNVEIVVARAAIRSFPMRLTETLGICIKSGPAHEVKANGQLLLYPADAICVRYPGCIWSCNTTESGFVSIDIAPQLLPFRPDGNQMKFLPDGALRDIRATIARFLTQDDRLSKQEALAELFSGLHEAHLADSEELGEDNFARNSVMKARDYLNSHFADHPTLDELAQAVSSNKFVLLRRFKRDFATTPHQYLVQLRIEKARALLAKGISSAQVAALVGFVDQTHLTRHFKRIVGVTPGQYARQLRSFVTV